MSDQGRATAALDVVTEMIAPLVAEARDLRTVVQADVERRREEELQRRQEDLQRRKENRLILGGVAVLCVIAVVLVILAAQDNRRRQQSREILRQNAETSQRIADCTTAGGRCYEEGRARSGQAIQELIQAQAAVGRCAKSEETVAGYDVCVKRALTPKPSSTP